jgi:DNA-binding CsgD family transcriptional regulator
MAEPRQPFRFRPGIAALGVAAFVVLCTLEFVTEDEPLRPLDALGDALQIALLVATAITAGVLATRMRAQHEERLHLIRDLDRARAEGERWRRDAHAYVAGLGSAIDRQFTSWGLTPAEREIGLLMLKGLSHKEIAAVRGTSDATVRHQAKAIYQKADVAGRTAFCSFFLEDLLPPNGLPSEATGDAATPPDAPPMPDVDD